MNEVDEEKELQEEEVFYYEFEVSDQRYLSYRISIDDDNVPCIEAELFEKIDGVDNSIDFVLEYNREKNIRLTDDDGTMYDLNLVASLSDFGYRGMKLAKIYQLFKSENKFTCSSCGTDLTDEGVSFDGQIKFKVDANGYLHLDWLWTDQIARCGHCGDELAEDGDALAFADKRLGKDSIDFKDLGYQGVPQEELPKLEKPKNISAEMTFSPAELIAYLNENYGVEKHLIGSWLDETFKSLQLPIDFESPVDPLIVDALKLSAELDKKERGAN